MRRPTHIPLDPLDPLEFPLTLAGGLRRTFADIVSARSEGSPVMVQALLKRRAVLIVEDDAELRNLTASLLKDEQLDTIECESAEAALAVMLMGAREVAMMFADVWLSGPMDGVDLAREVKMPWAIPSGDPHLGTFA